MPRFPISGTEIYRMQSSERSEREIFEETREKIHIMQIFGPEVRDLPVKNFSTHLGGAPAPGAPPLPTQLSEHR